MVERRTEAVQEGDAAEPRPAAGAGREFPQPVEAVGTSGQMPSPARDTILARIREALQVPAPPPRSSPNSPAIAAGSGSPSTADQVVPMLAEALDAARGRQGGRLPSMLTFITGPRRTGGIERILVLGAHGPKELFVILVG